MKEWNQFIDCAAILAGVVGIIGGAITNDIVLFILGILCFVAVHFHFKALSQCD